MTPAGINLARSKDSSSQAHKSRYSEGRGRASLYWSSIGHLQPCRSCWTSRAVISNFRLCQALSLLLRPGVCTKATKAPQLGAYSLVIPSPCMSRSPPPPLSANRIHARVFTSVQLQVPADPEFSILVQTLKCTAVRSPVMTSSIDIQQNTCRFWASWYQLCSKQRLSLDAGAYRRVFSI